MTMERGLEVWSLAQPTTRVDLRRNDDSPCLPWDDDEVPSSGCSEAARSSAVVCDSGRSMFAGEMEGLLVRGQTHAVGGSGGLGAQAGSLGAGSVRAPVDFTVPQSSTSTSSRVAQCSMVCRCVPVRVTVFLKNRVVKRKSRSRETALSKY